MNRRTTLQGIGALSAGAALGLPGCKAGEPDPDAGGAWRYAVYDGPDLVDHHGNGGWRDTVFGMDTPFRVASVTKMAVAELARRLHAVGRIDRDADVQALIGSPFRHPDHPSRPITIRHLLSHLGGVRDPDIYWMAHPGDIRQLMRPDMWEPGGEPGRTFRYSNFGYGLAATAIEAATGERFDRLFTQYIAEPLGLDIGLNWSGVSEDKRRRGMPGIRGRSDIQVDGLDVLTATQPAILIEDGASLSTYEPGRNGTLFSPQGGLRASLSDLAVLTHAILSEQPELWEPSWTWDGTVRPGGPSEDGHFVAFGEGLYIYPHGPLGDDTIRWIGHHGTAYGINCGTWFRADPDRPTMFLHTMTHDRKGIMSGMTGFRPNNSRAAFRAFLYGAESLRTIAAREQR